MTVAVETRKLWKTYSGDVHAVRGVDIRIEPGELMVLVGESGCGKTTTLRMVAGLERVTSGEVLVGDRVVNRIHPSKRGVALVFQNFALYPHKTAWENIAFPLQSQGVASQEIDRRVAEIAEMLELSAHLQKTPSGLSGGQQQRVSLGRAIVRNPDVLLLDEPLSNLDARLRVVMRSELKRIQRRVGSTAMYVTHDQVEAMTMGDRIVVMSKGGVAQIGTPHEVYLTPASLAVAQTIGSPAMNLLTGVAETHDNRVTIQGADWTLDVQDQGGAYLAQQLGRASTPDLVLGVRPEDLEILPASAEAGTTAATLGSGPCITAEPLGSETLYNVELGRQLVRVLRRESHVSLPEGTMSSVILRAGARLHVFDPSTDQRIAGLALLGDGTTARWSPFDSADAIT